MADTIEYNDGIIMSTLKDEVCEKAGTDTWEKLIQGNGVPDISTEGQSGCAKMRVLMERFDELIDEATGKNILTNVRHGLKRSQFVGEREKFHRYNDIDRFNEDGYENELKSFTELYKSGKDFYGQAITAEALEFVSLQPGMLAAIRKGNELHITAFPYNIVAYLSETNERKKRYHACHCPFARESILIENGQVSKTLCNCSLGHCKVRWDAIFDRELEGRVAESALNGGLLCKYVLFLPDDIMEKYVAK